jgi:hypothetical protein
LKIAAQFSSGFQAYVRKGPAKPDPVRKWDRAARCSARSGGLGFPFQAARNNMERSLTCAQNPALPGLGALINNHFKIAQQF